MMPQPLDEGVLRRIALAVVRAEVRRIRGTGVSSLSAESWPDTTPIGEEGLGLDSLERLGALGALSETFGLHDDELLPRTPPETVGEWIAWLVRSVQFEHRTISVMSSGSTGGPKACRHRVADLQGEAADLAAFVAGRRRVIALVPAHHLYGMIWTAFLPAALDIPVVDRTLGSPLGLQPGDLVVAVPDQWQAMMRMRKPVPEDCIAVSSAGLLADPLARELLAAGFQRVVDVYGSSETGAIALRDAPAAGYELMTRWTLQADASDWRIVDRGGQSVPMPDHVERLGPRRIKPVGRRDGAVKVGGNTVWPQRVERKLREHGGIADIAVRLGANGRLKAFVVPDGDIDPVVLSATLERYAAEQLDPTERPKSFRFGDALPRGDMGKLADWD